MLAKHKAKIRRLKPAPPNSSPRGGLRFVRPATFSEERSSPVSRWHPSFVGRSWLPTHPATGGFGPWPAFSRAFHQPPYFRRSSSDAADPYSPLPCTRRGGTGIVKCQPENTARTEHCWLRDTWRRGRNRPHFGRPEARFPDISNATPTTIYCS